MAEDYATRIAIIGPGPVQLTSVWRIWVKGSDIYATTRYLAGKFKTSLHASGKARHAYVSQAEAERRHGLGVDRAISKWNRDLPQGDVNRLIMQIGFPQMALGVQELDHAGLKKLNHALFPGNQDHVIFLNIYDCPANAYRRYDCPADALRSLGTMLMSYDNKDGPVLENWLMSNGRRLVIACVEIPMRPDIRERLKEQAKRMLHTKVLQPPSGANSKKPLTNYLAVVTEAGGANVWMEYNRNALVRWFRQDKCY